MFTSEPIQAGVLGHRVGGIADTMKGKYNRRWAIFQPMGNHKSKSPLPFADRDLFMRINIRCNRAPQRSPNQETNQRHSDRRQHTARCI